MRKASEVIPLTEQSAMNFVNGTERLYDDEILKNANLYGTERRYLL